MGRGATRTALSVLCKVCPSWEEAGCKFCAPALHRLECRPSPAALIRRVYRKVLHQRTVALLIFLFIQLLVIVQVTPRGLVVASQHEDGPSTFALFGGHAAAKHSSTIGTSSTAWLVQERCALDVSGCTSCGRSCCHGEAVICSPVTRVWENQTSCVFRGPV